MAKKKPKKRTAKKIISSSKAKGRKGKMICGKCIFYVPNKDIKGVGACFQVEGRLKENQDAKCKGKFFKPKKSSDNNESTN